MEIGVFTSNTEIWQESCFELALEVEEALVASVCDRK